MIQQAHGTKAALKNALSILRKRAHATVRTAAAFGCPVYLNPLMVCRNWLFQAGSMRKCEQEWVQQALQESDYRGLLSPAGLAFDFRGAMAPWYVTQVNAGTEHEVQSKQHIFRSGWQPLEYTGC